MIVIRWNMDNKITIIEGPTPTFEAVSANWADSICETPEPGCIMMTNLRTMNGPGLLERCHHTWSQCDTMYLHYRNTIGLEEKIPIIAAESLDTEDGQKLILWVVMPPANRGHVYIQPDDDFDDEDEDE